MADELQILRQAFERLPDDVLAALRGVARDTAPISRNWRQAEQR
jgi:hypothetical protein